MSIIANADHLPTSYQVQPGDTLSKVARTYGLTHQYLACINHIHDPHLIYVGQKINLPHRPHLQNDLDLNWPLSAGVLTSKFGPRWDTCHYGIDIAAPVQTPVQAAASGRVIYSGRMRGYGRVVIVQHNEVYSTVYAHHKRNLVKKGQWVERGDELATVGSSGRSTGPHLHFEVRVQGVALDPLLYLPQAPTTLVKG